MGPEGKMKQQQEGKESIFTGEQNLIKCIDKRGKRDFHTLLLSSVPLTQDHRFPWAASGFCFVCAVSISVLPRPSVSLSSYFICMSFVSLSLSVFSFYSSQASTLCLLNESASLCRRCFFFSDTMRQANQRGS